jgi:glycosyltransferase involved in cell wall biosynthesis
MTAVDGKLRIVHCFRSPVGGIFRHVRDLVDAQRAEGHEVGILLDSITGGDLEEGLVREIAPKLALGVHRVTMRRSIAPSDLPDLWRTYSVLRDIRPDVLHGHGSKGGAYARIVGTAIRLSGQQTARLYTPHGGSMHFDASLPRNRYFFFVIERLLERLTDHLLFVSRYEADAYRTKIGEPGVPSRIVHNGLRPAEFEPIVPDVDAADFVYLGMLREMKGPDLLIEAIGRMANSGGSVGTAVIVGAGPQKHELERMASALAPGLVRFVDPTPVRTALRLGRVLVLPSRADSLPYVLLEAVAAGRPVIATDVGGVGEIIPRDIQELVPACDSEALATAMSETMARGPSGDEALRDHVRDVFSIERMTTETMQAYRRALGAML